MYNSTPATLCCTVTCICPFQISDTHADFQPSLMLMNVVQSFTGSFSFLMLRVAGYTAGVAKYPKCAGQFSVHFAVSPAADVSNMTIGSIAQYNITNLERCTVYDIFAQLYQCGQLIDTYVCCSLCHDQ